MFLWLEKGIILRPLENVCGHPYVCVKSFFIFVHSWFKLLTCFLRNFPLGLTQAWVAILPWAHYFASSFSNLPLTLTFNKKILCHVIASATISPCHICHDSALLPSWCPWLSLEEKNLIWYSYGRWEEMLQLWGSFECSVK